MSLRRSNAAKSWSQDAMNEGAHNHGINNSRSNTPTIQLPSLQSSLLSLHANVSESNAAHRYNLSGSGYFTSSDSKSSYEDADTDEDIEFVYQECDNNAEEIDIGLISSDSDDDSEKKRNFFVGSYLCRNVLLRFRSKKVILMFLILTFFIVDVILYLLSFDAFTLSAIAAFALLVSVIYAATLLELVLINTLLFLGVGFTIRRLARKHLRYTMSVITVKHSWSLLLYGVSNSIEVEINRALLAIITVDVIWFIWMIIFYHVLDALKTRTFGKDVYQLVLQERALQRLCCENEKDVDEWIGMEQRNSNSFKNFRDRAERIRTSRLLLPLRRVVKRKQRGRTIVWKFSTSALLGIKSATEIERVVDIMWKNLTHRSGSESVATIHCWTQLFKKKSLAYKTFASLFNKNINDVDAWCEFTFSDLSKAIEMFFVRRMRIASTLWNWESLSNVALNLSNMMFWLCMIFVTAGIYGIPISGVLVTLSSLMLSLAFAFGPVISKIVSSAIFIFVAKPFDVGDLVRIGAGGGLMTVASIELLTTSFTALNSQRVMMYNTRLIESDIYNLRRTASAWVEFNFEVSFHTSKEMVEALRVHVCTFIKGKENTWKKKIEFFVTKLNKTNSMIISIWLENRLNFHSVMDLARAKTDVFESIREKMIDLGMRCDPPIYSLKMENSGAGNRNTSKSRTLSDVVNFPKK